MNFITSLRTKNIVTSYKAFLILLIFLIPSLPNYAQKANITPRDSLLLLPNDSSKVNKILNLSETYAKANNLQEAVQLGQQALTLSQEIHFTYGIYQSHYLIGTYQRYLEKHSQAIDHQLKAAGYFQKANQKPTWRKILREMGINYAELGDNVKALQYFLKALKITNQQKETNELGSLFTALGIIHSRQQEYPRAIYYYKKALKIFTTIKNAKSQASSYVNLCNAYNKKGSLDTALVYCQKALSIHQNLEHPRHKAIALCNIGFVYTSKKQYTQAIVYHRQAFQVFDSLGIIGKLMPLRGLGEAYAGLGDFDQSIALLTKAKNIAVEHQQTPRVAMLLKTLADVEEQAGNYQAALQHYKQYKLYQDSIFNKKNTKKLTQAIDEYRFSKERDSLQFVQQKKQMTLEAEINTRKANQQTTYIGLGLTLLLLIVSSVFYRFKQQSHHRLAVMNESLAEVNHLLQEQNSEITAQRDAIEVRNEQLFSANHQIKQSIRAAKVIQAAMLPFKERMEKYLSEYFLIYRPRDIVSGDFYWIGQKGDETVVIAADCTGHGIPGAFMSMISFMMLNKIINTQKITDPAQILTHLQQDILQALKSKNNFNPGGLDAAVVCIRPLANQQVGVRFAGARRPLWYITPQDTHIQKVTGSRISIGVIYRQPRFFTSQEFVFEKDTLLYIGSDGLVDQHGTNKKMFGTQALLDLLAKEHQQALGRQKQAIENALLQHQQEVRQTDDILLMGIRV